MQWLRLYHDTATDPKWRLVAVESGQTVANVLAVWTCMMINASQAEPRGILSGWSDRIVGASIDLKGDAVAAIRTAMQGIVLDGDLLTGWERRQRVGDSSADRVRQYRERLHASTGRKRTPYDTKEVIERDGGACVYCFSTESLCVDHMVPVILGGDHQSDNLACACKKCNSGKSGRTPEQAGYTIQSPEALARYRDAVKRMGINRVTVTRTNENDGTVTEQDVTVTDRCVTVTGEGVTVTPLRAQTPDSESEEESKKESPHTPPLGVGGDLFSEGSDAPAKSAGKPLGKLYLPQSAIDDAFKRFQAAYPRRNVPHTWSGDKGGKAKFHRYVKSGIDPEILISAAERFARSMRSQGKIGDAGVCDALTWLNQQRWELWGEDQEAELQKSNVHPMPFRNGHQHQPQRRVAPAGRVV